MWEAVDGRHMVAEGTDAERTVVKTYVPAHQKETWSEHADRLDMSQSEFLRTMVQAGRRSFEIDPEEPGSAGSDPGGSALEDRILGLLRERGGLEFDELVDGLTEDLEDRVDDALADLQRDDVIRYSGRKDRYELVEGAR